MVFDLTQQSIQLIHMKEDEKKQQTDQAKTGTDKEVQTKTEENTTVSTEPEKDDETDEGYVVVESGLGIDE